MDSKEWWTLMEQSILHGGPQPEDMLLKKILNKAEEFSDAEQIVLEQFASGIDFKDIHPKLKEELKIRAKNEERRIRKIVSKYKKEQ